MENLGKLGKDKVTGFTGIITSKIYYLFGCAQYGMSPKVDENGKKPQIEWFDTGRVEIIGPGVLPEEVTAAKPGGENREHP